MNDSKMTAGSYFTSIMSKFSKIKFSIAQSNSSSLSAKLLFSWIINIPICYPVFYILHHNIKFYLAKQETALPTRKTPYDWPEKNIIFTFINIFNFEKKNPKDFSLFTNVLVNRSVWFFVFTTIESLDVKKKIILLFFS
jgi:hypothetical protein